MHCNVLLDDVVLPIFLLRGLLGVVGVNIDVCCFEVFELGNTCCVPSTDFQRLTIIFISSTF